MFVMLAASFMSMFDRSTMPPMLTAIAVDLGSSVGGVGAALSALAVTYAISQLAWSAVSSRLGQVPVLRMGFFIATAGSLLSACAVDPVMLGAARGLSGIAVGAVIPSTLVYVADRFPIQRRVRALADLATSTSIGATAAVLVASVLGPLGGWRWVFVGTAVAELVLALLLLRVDAGPRPVAPVSIVRSATRVLSDGWAVLILLLVLVEGILLIGVMSFLPAALHSTGTDPILSGVVTAVYGVALIATAQLMKLVLGRIPAGVLMLIGGGATVAGFLLLSIAVSVVTVLIASVLFGFAWAFAHTQLQNWMTDAVARDRPVGTALFATGLFTGGAIGAAIGSAAAAADDYEWMFIGSTIGAVVFAVAASIGRTRYRVRAS